MTTRGRRQPGRLGGSRGTPKEEGVTPNHPTPPRVSPRRCRPVGDPGWVTSRDGNVCAFGKPGVSSSKVGPREAEGPGVTPKPGPKCPVHPRLPEGGGRLGVHRRVPAPEFTGGTKSSYDGRKGVGRKVGWWGNLPPGPIPRDLR